MHLSLILTLALTGLTTAIPAEKQQVICGPRLAPCPEGYACRLGERLLTGVCVRNPVLTAPIPTRVIPTATARPRPSATPTYQSCGGFRIQSFECPKGQYCVDDPRVEGCGMACDRPGICVTPADSEFCGGFAGFACKDPNKLCIDDPRDDCDPRNGGADCGGICV
ncbi:hypothetical protein QBC38DRAFT_481606 [Podospora fimiseda]|uniref:Uncharacterized protein n=1 Tax=Podospora fimiseda TaxID=252190 RepID=A0AAN7BMJ3_9PEZI|nr:hypothetical protein QBC38DRAFT_481606 [Podospora fimiseda]